jgi:hypothetical protein
MVLSASTQPRRHIHDYEGGHIKNDLELYNHRSLRRAARDLNPEAAN